MFLTITLCTYTKLNCLKSNSLFVKIDLALIKLQRMIFHKTHTNKLIGSYLRVK